jgi:hypothetical protein
MLVLPSSEQARSHRNLQNIKDKQVDQAADTRPIRHGWTQIAVRSECSVMECQSVRKAVILW